MNTYVEAHHPKIKYPFYVAKRLEPYWHMFIVSITGFKSNADFRRFQIDCPSCPVPQDND